MSAVRLAASVDTTTQQTYLPPRRFAADGSLRTCDPIDMSSRGVLRGFTSIGGRFYGLLDLDHDVRVQAPLDDGPHEVGATYEGRASGETASAVLRLDEAVFSRA